MALQRLFPLEEQTVQLLFICTKLMQITKSEGQNYSVSGHYPSSCSYLEHNVSETGICLRLQVETTQLGIIDNLFPRSGDRDWAQLSSFHLKTETELSLRNVTCFT
jgi:hypothetical protein